MREGKGWYSLERGKGGGVWGGGKEDWGGGGGGGGGMGWFNLVNVKGKGKV